MRLGLAGGLFLLLAVSASFPARAEPLPPLFAAWPALAEGTVAEVPDGTTLKLADGRVLRLDGLAPLLGSEDAAVAATAQKLLAELALHHRLSLRGPAAGIDRYGRLRVSAVLENGDWLQAALIAAGGGVTAPDEEDRAAAPDLLALEAAARQARQGIWRFDRMQPLVPDGLDYKAGRFVLVEGVPERAAVYESGGYLDFGPAGSKAGRDGFSVRLDRRALTRFRRAGIALAGYEGKRLRLRGWLVFEGRPILDVDFPEQIEPEQIEPP